MSESKTEFVDDPTEVDQKLAKLVALIKESKYCVMYSGAGISTAANIPDYSGDNGLKKNPKPLIVLGNAEKNQDFTMPTLA